MDECGETPDMGYVEDAKKIIDACKCNKHLRVLCCVLQVPGAGRV